MAMESRPRRTKVSLTLDADMPAFLTQEAAVLGTNMSHIARLAIRAYMATRQAARERTPEELAAQEIEGPTGGAE